MESFRVRLNCIDHYQATSTRYDARLRSDIQSSPLSATTKVPVIRIFGSTEYGQKVCAHVHGVFPYLYVEYDGSLDQREVGLFMYRLHLSIDQALAVSYRRDRHGDQAKFVARITVAKGIPFYGFHVGYKVFLKIYMLNPMVMTRLADLLQQGVIMKKKFQPFEAHLQYILQFMVDYNLYGCDYLDSSLTYFRSPIPSYDAQSGTAHLWHDASVLTAHVTEDPSLPRLSHCSIEVDICAQHILNRDRVNERPLHHDFTEFLRPTSGEKKLVSSMAGLWKDEAQRLERQNPYSQQTDAPNVNDGFISMSADLRCSQPGMWVHEDDYRRQLQNMVADESNVCNTNDLKFDTFITEVSEQEPIKTALASVDDLHPSNLAPLFGLNLNATYPDDNGSHTDVNEAKALGKQVSALGISKTKFARGDYRHIAGLSLGGAVGNSLPNIPVSVTLLQAIRHNNLVDGEEIPTSAQPDTTYYKRKRSLSPAAIQHKKLKIESTLTSTTQLVSGAIEPASRLEGGGGTEPLTPEDPQSSDYSSVDFDWSELEALVANSPDAKGLYDEPELVSSSEVEGAISEGGYEDEDASCSTQPSVSSPSAIDGQSLVDQTDTEKVVVFAMEPPSQDDATDMNIFRLPTVVYRNVSYGKEKDVPKLIREYAGKEFRIGSNTLPFLPAFDPSGVSAASHGAYEFKASHTPLGRKHRQRERKSCSWRSWEFAVGPPAFTDVAEWSTRNNIADLENSHHQGRRAFLSQIEGPSPKKKYDSKYMREQGGTSVRHEVQYMSTMSLEVHVNTRGSFVPNPEEDEIQCIFWFCKGDEEGAGDTQEQPNSLQSGIIALSPDGSLAEAMRRLGFREVVQETMELDLIVRMIEIVRAHDPDILTGYEVHGGSWGYLIERARVKYDYDLCNEFSRMKSHSHGRFGKQSDRWGFNTTSTIRVTGRHMINIWRAMRGELNLLQYTIENVAWHLLQRRIPHYSWETLTSWHRSGRARDLFRLLRYYRLRTKLDLDIIERNELIPRTSEQARLLGVDFFSVFSRGSQFKVESIMSRIAKPENFIMVSPSRKQVGGQNALECIPLVMEPQSGFYSSPLIVLDFQSLYPSVMIAYNYCYSTFLGRITDWRGKSKMGFTEYQRQQGLLTLLKDYINIAPNGMMYAKPQIRKSLLAKMLTEILETRVMVKNGMKRDKDDQILQQVLNNRQLALKLLANVTYGYTSASFSGRMPCSEIADSIVQTGRETLERAIAYIHSVGRWGAEVVYGDTDSLFIYLKGRSRDEAFQIGQEIADAITERNPRPIKLKFEKVYHPCVLLAKKRYVGYKYESKDQVTPEFDAKGIETVRRDGTPAEQKIEERALRLLFETSDLSKVKRYFQRQCTKIMCGRVSIQDFCFAKEVRLGTYSERGQPPAGALISTRRMLRDARAEPQYGERVPYVVISGAPGARLIDRSVSPEELLNNPQWRLDANYYISKNLIPPLERIFNLVGANVRQWYDEMPKIKRINHSHNIPRKGTLEAYLKPANCANCRRRMIGRVGEPLCRHCWSNVPETLLTLQTRLVNEERKLLNVQSVCQSCEGIGPLEEVKCNSQDCPVFWTRMKQQAKSAGERAFTQPLIQSLAAGARGRRRV